MVMVVKNILNYYYHIIIDECKIDDDGKFIYNNHLYCLYELKRNINEIDSLYILNEIMLSRNNNINKIIKNVFNQIVTFSGNKNYILIEIKYEYIENASVKFIEIFLDKKLDILKRNNWGELWSTKIDYVEYQLLHIKNSYPIINSSVNYYIGLAENAISYFNMLDLSNVPLFIEHRRYNRETIYNPLELVFDYKVRDIAEYIKDCFFYQKMNVYEIKNYISKLNLDNIDYVLLYVRLLYPSYYFDLYEDIINSNIDEQKIKVIIDLSMEYENLLYEIYLIIQRKVNIMGVNWINSKFM